MRVTEKNARAHRPLTDEALLRLARELRTAHLEADLAKAKYLRRNDELNAKMDAQPVLYSNWMTRRTFRVDDIERRDHLDDYYWWIGEENRIAAMIQAERNLRDLLSYASI